MHLLHPHKNRILCNQQFYNGSSLLVPQLTQDLYCGPYPVPLQSATTWQYIPNRAVDQRWSRTDRISASVIDPLQVTSSFTLHGHFTSASRHPMMWSWRQSLYSNITWHRKSYIKILQKCLQQLMPTFTTAKISKLD